MDTFRLLRPEPAAADARAAELCSMTERLDATLRTSEALLRGGRQVDLCGLNIDIGRMCAASLDLPPEQGRAFREKLAKLLKQLNPLEAALRATRAGP